jgi:hypothetical protein
VTDPTRVIELYHTLGHPADNGTSGGNPGKAKSRPPLATEAIDLRAELEDWTIPGLPTAAYVSVLVDHAPGFDDWVTGWLDRAECLLYGSNPRRPLYGAACVGCGAASILDGSGGWEPAVSYWPDLRSVSCSSCGWEDVLPDLTVPEGRATLAV